GGRIIKYDWNWRDLTPHNISTSPTATHIYTVPGLYEIVLTVTDESGLTGNNVTYIKVSYPPRAYAGEDKEQRVSWVVNFDDCWGYDPDGIITKYDWNFGDGTTWSSTISPRTNHIYTLSGTYVATLTVTNGDGLEINAASLTATDSCLVTIVDNFPPVADAGPDRQIRYDRIIQFNGAGSYDKDGYIVSYYWDFGDGQFSYELAPIHVYHVPGNYTVILTVTDNEGATGSDTCTVRVTGNENPIANAGSDRIAYVNQEITFDGSASYDPDGYIVSYVWDLGDGTSATGISATHAYSIGNTIYYVRLTVTDNDGATGSDVCIVTVITNLGPEASLFANLYPFYQVTLRWKPVTFQARAYDPDGYIVKYEWCFGDGPPTEVYTQGAPSSVSSEVTHSFGGSKDYNVEYTVTFTAWDNQGAKVTARAWVYVLSNRKPVLYAGEDRAKYVNEALNKSWNKTVTFLILALDPDGELTKIDVDFGDGTPIQQCIAQSKNLSAEETEALLQKLTVTIPPELPFESLLRESGWLVRESLHYFFGEILEDTLVDIIGEFIPVEASKGTRILLLIFVVATGIAGVITTVLGAKKLCDEAYESGRRCSIDKFKYSLQYYWEVKLGLREPGYILNKTEIAKRLRVCAVNHTYQEIGEYLVNVKVYDNDSAEDNESFRLILYDNIPPAGSSETGIGRANSPTNIMFIGRDFENNIARFEIDFGDGTSETILATDPRISLSVHRYFPDMEHTVYNLSATLTHIYTKGGIYNVTLKIVDEKGANFTITKKAKIYPLADAGPDKTVKVNKPAEFKGTGWTLDADFKKFWWDCNQDGVEDATWINETKIAKATTVGVVTGRFDTIYTYTTIRVYNATFGLRDTLDALAEDICVVTVVANEPPVANAGPDRFARYYTSVMFDGSKSYDVDGIIVNYTWEFGDGGVGYGVNTTHVYTTLGTYIVTLTVKDDDGDTNSDTCTVNVTDNLPPIANAGPDQYVYVHQIVQFNGSASFDPDGNIANYTWNFNDPYNQTPGYGATPMHIYTHPGIYTVTLTVTDDKGAKAMDICLVYVYNNLPPEVDPGTDQIRPFGYPVNFYATAKDSDDRIVKMEWDYGDGKKDTKLLDETGIVTWDTKHMYCVPHGYENLTESITIKYNATLTVWDNRGGVSSRTCIIEMRLDLRPPAIS
ncbi:MAG: PKD domain-containing protein, partial [Candidatus Thermoplasmatota archaeon]